MKSLLPTFLLLVFLMTGCSTIHYQPESFLSPSANGSLWKIRLVRGEKELFAGILALGQADEKLPFQLLDPTGITLLTASVDHEGLVEIKSAVSKVKKSRLPSYLGQGLKRIFFDKNKRQANEPINVDMSKEAHWGFFTLWTVDYIKDKEKMGSTGRIVLDLWWPQPDLFLEAVEN